MRKIARTDEEIDNVMNIANYACEEEISKWPSKSYEDGILSALEWLFGAEEINPIDDVLIAAYHHAHKDDPDEWEDSPAPQ